MCDNNEEKEKLIYFVYLVMDKVVTPRQMRSCIKWTPVHSPSYRENMTGTYKSQTKNGIYTNKETFIICVIWNCFCVGVHLFIEKSVKLLLTSVSY